MIRERITEFWSIHWYSKRNVGDVFYLILRNKKDTKLWYNGKKGEIKDFYVWMSNADNSYDDNDDFMKYFDDNHFESLDVITDSEPLLVGKLYGRDFYFKGELMSGTPTDETQPTDFIEVLMDFKEIARNVNGTPEWDDEKLFFKRQDDKFTFELNT